MKKRIITLILSLTMCISLFNLDMGTSYAKREIVQITKGYSTDGLELIDFVRIYNKYGNDKGFHFAIKGSEKKYSPSANRKTPK